MVFHGTFVFLFIFFLCVLLDERVFVAFVYPQKGYISFCAIKYPGSCLHYNNLFQFSPACLSGPQSTLR